MIQTDKQMGVCANALYLQPRGQTGCQRDGHADTRLRECLVHLRYYHIYAAQGQISTFHGRASGTNSWQRAVFHPAYITDSFYSPQ